MIEMRTPVKAGATPAEISVSMIDQDLKDGVSKSEMAIKYGIKPWEVDEIFKHPFLKGRRPSRKKALSFTFIDDAPQDAGVLDQIKEAVEEGDLTDPNQVTLEEAIDDAIESAEEAKVEMKKAVDAIEDMFPTAEDTLDLVEDQEMESGNIEEEIEEDDDTFEL